MPTSGRRLQKQGFLKMAGLYFVNFFSIVFRGKPATQRLYGRQMSGPARIFTIGYEGATQAELIAALRGRGRRAGDRRARRAAVAQAGLLEERARRRPEGGRDRLCPL